METRQVTTIAGTGKRGEDPLTANLNMREQSLSTPFDIAYDKDLNCFYIAMSGIHQIWKLDMVTSTIRPLSGSGVEGCHDDHGDLMKCTWAQPSGVSFGVGLNDKKELYIADSESSTIRGLNLTDLDSARTCVGGDGSSTNLFCYGDKDGEGISAKLQHPVGLHYVNIINKVIVADSYNHKIKLLDPKTNEIFTLYGNGQAGLKDGEGEHCQLMEPTDICHKYDKEKDQIYLYIADSSNDAIRKVLIYSEGQLLRDGQVETIQFKKIPSVVDAVKSDMVECGEGGCRWVRSKKSESKASQQPVDPISA